MELRFPLILDGATGTELQKRGYTGDIGAEQWTLAHPEAIQASTSSAAMWTAAARCCTPPPSAATP